MKSGDKLPEMLVDITRQDLIRYAGAANDYLPQHWDQAMMQAQGFADVVVHGWLGCAHLCRAASALYVPDRWTLARYAVQYRQPLFPGQARCGGEVADVTGTTHQVSGWIKNASGVVVTTATLWFVARDTTDAAAA